MLNFGPKFYDKYGNFNNEKFIGLLNKTKKSADLKRRGKKKGQSVEINLFNRVRKKELWGFINKMSIFINSGIDIKATLNLLTKQVKNPYLKKITFEMKDNIDHGITVSETMKRYPKVFDTLTMALIGVGEKTGQLGKILQELDISLMESIEIRGKVKSAMIYPILLLTMTIGVTIFLLTFVVPKVTAAFTETGVKLPTLTQWIVSVADFVKNEYIFLISVILMIIIAYRIYVSTYVGKYSVAVLMTRLPIVGFVVRQSNIVYFTKSFTLLLDSGVLLLESLKTSSEVVSNLAYRKELIRVKNEVELGLTISKSLGLNIDYSDSIYLNNLFPEDFAYVVSTGEETGSLSASLKRLGENYNLELKRYIGNLSSMMEPLVIILVGGIVGTIIIGIMLPFFEIGKVVQQM